MNLDNGNEAATGDTRRTMAKGVGHFVEELHLYATDKRLSAAERQDIVEDALRFEECSYSEQELLAMDDAALIGAYYWVMAEYASGQV
jgi:hypothetical protein